ncbi:MAG: ThuA domain-containing protein [Planctomycetota bacterium]
MNHAVALTILLGCALLLSCHATVADEAHPVPESDLWLTYKGGDGPGSGKHIVLLAGEQEYRAEQALPMLARTLSTHHGFDCTVIFLMNEDGLVDPTGPSPIKEKDQYNIVPGMENLAKADAFIWKSRFLKLSDEDADHLYNYFDSGKPIIALRTANHGLHSTKPYLVNGKKVSLRELLGGAFMKHHGGWKREATSGFAVEENKGHPILIGVKDVWGTTDVYRCHKEDTVPADCTPLLMGQPMKTLERDAPPNTNKAPLPIAWTKTWTGNDGKASPILHFTMGSAKDFENEGVRRVIVNGVYWGLGMADQIKPDSDMSIIGEYKPMKDGFNYEKLGVKPRPASYFR